MASGSHPSPVVHLLFFYLENLCSLVVGMGPRASPFEDSLPLRAIHPAEQSSFKHCNCSRSSSVLPCAGPWTHWSVSLTWPSFKTLPICLHWVPATYSFLSRVHMNMYYVWCAYTHVHVHVHIHTCGGHLSECCTSCFLRRSLMGLSFAWLGYTGWLASPRDLPVSSPHAQPWN